MDLRRVLASSPRKLRLGSEQTEASYELAEDLIATHDAEPTPEALLTLEGEAVAVEPLTAISRSDSKQDVVGPVYRQAPGGGLAVPTGRVFVRFADGDSAARHEADLAKVGYDIEQIPAHAPHTAWVRAATGAVADGLRGVGRLERVPGIENVEPQLLKEPVHRL